LNIKPELYFNPKNILPETIYSKTYSWIIISLIILVNILIKSYSIGITSMDLDEAYSVFNAQKEVSDLWQMFNDGDNGDAPLYYFTLHYWMGIFGNTILSARSFSLFANICNIIALYLFAKRHLNFNTAIYISILLTVLSLQFYFAQEARVYALSSLFSILSVWCFFELIKEQKLKQIVLLGFINGALLYAHYSMFVLPVAQLIIMFFYLFRAVKTSLYFVVSQLISLLIALPSLLLIDIKSSKGSWSWMRSPTWSNITLLFEEFSNNYFTFIVMMLLFGLFLVVLLTNMKEPKLWVLFGIAFGVFSVSYLVSQFIPMFSSRYLFYLQQFIWLLIVYSISLIRQPFKHLLLVLSFMFLLFSLKPKQEREDWKSTVQYAKEMKKKGYTIIVSPSYMSMPFTYYFDKSKFEDYNNLYPSMLKDDVIFIKLMDRELFDYIEIEKVVFISSHQDVVDPNNENMRILDERYRFQEKRAFKNIECHVFNE